MVAFGMVRKRSTPAWNADGSSCSAENQVAVEQIDRRIVDGGAAHMVGYGDPKQSVAVISHDW
jgi:hypothetical protein